MFLFTTSYGLKDTDVIIQSGDGKSETMDIAGFKLTIAGFQGQSKESSFFQGTGSALGNIIVELFGIEILWIAVMTALKSSQTTGKIVEPIASFGKSVGSLIASAPAYAPIIPTGGGGSLSAASMSTL